MSTMNKGLGVILLGLAFSFPLSGRLVFGQAKGIPKTGQAAVYHLPDTNDPGDDGAVQAGYPLSGFRFQDNGNTVTDLATGLMWQKACSATQTFNYLSGKLSWPNAFSYVKGMNSGNFAGYRDWRVPNIKELISIADMSAMGPSAHMIFSYLQADGYWSGTSYALDSRDWVFYFHFSSGDIRVCVYTDVGSVAYIKAVRSASTAPGEQGFPKTGQTVVEHPASGYDLGDDGAIQAGYPTTGASFLDQGNGTVAQVAAGLVWQQGDSLTQAFGQQTGALAWEDAFDYIRSMNAARFAGYDDWRLPNYFESICFLDLGYYYPCVHDLFRSSTQNDWYWSSTTLFGISMDQAWCINPASGGSNYYTKSLPRFVRAVRGGPLPIRTPSPAVPTPTPGPASVRGVPKTGQTDVYHGAGPDDFGDDGATRIGCPLVDPRFAAGTQTVVDNATQLMWQRAESSSQSFGGFSGKMTWAQSFQYVAAMNSQDFGGHNDWRLPNIKEIWSILDLGRYLPSCPAEYFSGTQNDFYWGSTTYADLINGQYVYQVNFTEGNMGFVYINDSPLGYVRAVRTAEGDQGTWGFPRSGQKRIIHYPTGYDRGDDGAIQAGAPASGPRFIDNGDGTVTDRASQLVWQKGDSSNQAFGGLQDSLSWDNAFAYVREMNTAGYTGRRNWRLPNYFELLSVLDYSQFSSTLDPLMKASTRAGLHWSATSRDLHPTTHGWAVNCWNGYGTFFPKTDVYFVKAVLGGSGQAIGPTPDYPTPTPLPSQSPTGPTPPPFTPTPLLPPATPLPSIYFGLPKTGQTDAYHGGDDGATQVGYPVSGGRFLANPDGTVSDLATGLMWQERDSYTQSFGGISGPVTWDEAFQYAAAMNAARVGGHADWRVPNALELLSIRNLGRNSPTAYSIFPATAVDYYWTGTGFALGEVKSVFCVGFSVGQMLHDFDPDKPITQAYIKAVRTLYDGLTPRGFPKTGQTASLHPAGGYDLGDDAATRAGYPAYGDRFLDPGNGTVTDNATGLIWQLMDSNTRSFGGEQGAMTWDEAFDYVGGMNDVYFAGGNDWRLPNQMELFSLIDYGEWNPAVSEPFKPYTQTGLYWSGTTDDANTARAFAVFFLSGYGDIFDKEENLFSVRAVRGMPLSGPRPTPTPQSVLAESGDYDGDGAADIGVFRPANGLWVIRDLTRFYFGTRGDLPVSGDYDGDGVCEAAIFRNTKGFWAVRETTSFYLGGSGDLPIPGDYSGDGTTRGAIFRGKDGLWSIRAATRFFLGCAIDLPVPGDYNGDGTEDAALFRSLNGQWAVRGITRFYSGGPGDQAVRLDADGDGDDDAGIFRAAFGLWAIRGFPRYYLGTSGDLPVPADYDGKEIDERAVFRPAAGFWSVSGVTRAYCGTSADLPLSR
jgi:hypothetical protein